jgi:hypothetical protein
MNKPASGMQLGQPKVIITLTHAKAQQLPTLPLKALLHSHHTAAAAVAAAVAAAAS